jgi:hypothetical protein
MCPRNILTKKPADAGVGSLELTGIFFSIADIMKR